METEKNFPLNITAQPTLKVDTVFLESLTKKLEKVVSLYYTNAYVAIESLSYEFDQESDKFDSIIDISIRYGREATDTDSEGTTFYETLSIDSDAPLNEDFIAGMFYRALIEKDF